MIRNNPNERFARRLMSGERHMPQRDYPHHRIAAVRYLDQQLRKTHVCVGDHQPEKKVEHEDQR